MKNKIVFFLLILIFVSRGFSFEQAEEVPRLVYTAKSKDWYKNQADLWEKTIKENPGDSNAWYNYYKAYRYANFSNLGDKKVQQHLIETLNDMEKYVPESFEYLLLRSSKIPFGDEKRLEMLLKAYNIQPDNPQTYYDLTVIYDLEENTKMETEFYKRLYHSNDIASGLLEYNYNVLLTLEDNAILFTNGDNDTYPAKLLQAVFNIRPDVTILNLSMSKGIPGYLEKKLDKLEIEIDLDDLPEKKSIDFLSEFCRSVTEKYPDKPIYFALTVYDQVFKSFKSDMYIVGLAYRYSHKRIDNIAAIKKNINKNFRLDYLQYDWYEEIYLATQVVKKLNNNYVAPMLILAEHYFRSGDREEADRLINRIRKISVPGKMEIDIYKYFLEKGIDIN